MTLSFDDLVVTPTGRLALVVRQFEEGEKTEIEYVDEPRAEHARVILPTALLRKVHKGQPLPEPVRIEFHEFIEYSASDARAARVFFSKLPRS